MKVYGVRFVYKLSRADGTLLYVGSADDVYHRLTEHRRERPWWSEVGMVEVEPCSPPSRGWQLETHLLRTSPGLYNIDASANGRAAWVRRKAAQEAAHAVGGRCNDAACRFCKDARRRMAVAS